MTAQEASQNRDAASIARPVGDPLGEILHLLKLTGTFYCQSRLSAPWGIEVPAFDGVMCFAVVTSGRGWLSVGSSEPLLIEQGSLVLLNGGLPHCFRSDPSEPVIPLEALPVRKITEIYEMLDYGGGGATTSLMYGIVRMDHAAGGLLMELLPNVLKIDSWSGEAGNWLQGTLQFIASEARELRPGGETVITRLADVVVIEAIRRWIDTAPETEQGWLKGARDPQVGRAIMAIHRAPAQAWTVESLARTAGLSRSAFSARFTALIGLSAMQYLTVWRMHVARAMLQQSSHAVAAIAAEVGYQSEPAFSRAFKRVFAETPGRARRRPTVDATSR